MDFIFSPEFAAKLILSNLIYIKKIVSVCKGWSRAVTYKYGSDIKIFIGAQCISQVDTKSLIRIGSCDNIDALSDIERNILLGATYIPCPIIELYLRKAILNYVEVEFTFLESGYVKYTYYNFRFPGIINLQRYKYFHNSIVYALFMDTHMLKSAFWHRDYIARESFLSMRYIASRSSYSLSEEWWKLRLEKRIEWLSSKNILNITIERRQIIEKHLNLLLDRTIKENMKLLFNIDMDQDIQKTKVPDKDKCIIN